MILSLAGRFLIYVLFLLFQVNDLWNGSERQHAFWETQVEKQQDSFGFKPEYHDKVDHEKQNPTDLKAPITAWCEHSEPARSLVKVRWFLSQQGVTLSFHFQSFPYFPAAFSLSLCHVPLKLICF